MKAAVFIAVFVAGTHVGALVALFVAHRLDGPRPRFAAVRGFGHASAPSPAVPEAEPIVPTALLAGLPKPLVVSDVQVIPGRSGWGRPMWQDMNIQFAQPGVFDDDTEPQPVPDGDREVDGGEDERPYGLADGGSTKVWARGPLTEQAASLARRLGRLFGADEHEGWEHGHMHELRGNHDAGEVADEKPDHKPAHSTDGDTHRLPVGSVQRAVGGAS